MRRHPRWTQRPDSPWRSTGFPRCDVSVAWCSLRGGTRSTLRPESIALISVDFKRQRLLGRLLHLERADDQNGCADLASSPSVSATLLARDLSAAFGDKLLFGGLDLSWRPAMSSGWWGSTVPASRRCSGCW